MPNAHFYGLNSFINIQSQGTRTWFSIMFQPPVNIQMYFITVARVYTACPVSYPYYTPSTSLCETNCTSGTYLVP